MLLIHLDELHLMMNDSHSVASILSHPFGMQSFVSLIRDIIFDVKRFPRSFNDFSEFRIFAISFP